MFQTTNPRSSKTFQSAQGTIFLPPLYVPHTSSVTVSYRLSCFSLLLTKQRPSYHTIRTFRVSWFDLLHEIEIGGRSNLKYHQLKKVCLAIYWVRMR